MIEHIVMFRWKDGTPAEAIEAVAARFAELPGKISAIRDFHFGPNIETARSGGYTHALYSRFDSRDDLGVYAVHEAHVDVVTNSVKPHLDACVVADLDRG